MKWLIAISLCLLAGCSGTGGGASSPTSPAQIPTSVEYAGGDVTGDISVLSSGSLGFVAKNADGNAIDDSSVITASLLLPDGTTVGTADIGKAAQSVSYGSVTKSGSNLTYQAPSGDISNTNQLTLQFSYAGTVLNSYTTLISPSKTDVESGRYTPADKLTITGQPTPTPSIASNKQSNLYICYHGTANSVTGQYFRKSEDDGETWGDPVLIEDDADAQNCVVEVRGNKVAVAWSTNFNSAAIAISTDGGDTFGTPSALDGRFYDMEFDSQDRLHMIKHDGTMSVYNIDYLVYNTTDFTTPITGPIQANGEDASVMVDSIPRLAVSADGANVYIVWEDHRDWTNTTRFYDLYYATLANGAFTETKISPSFDNSVSLTSLDMNISIDRNNTPVISWNMFTADILGYVGEAAIVGNYYMAVYLEVRNSSGTFDRYLVDSASDFSVDPTWWYGRTSVVADYANNYHVFYRNGEQLNHRMVTIAGGQLTETNAIAITPSDTNITDVATDYQGRNFIVSETGADSNNRTVTVQSLSLSQE